MSKTFQSFLITFFVFLILINFKTLFDIEYRGLKSGLLIEGLTDFPGKNFLPLKPLLQDVHVAGYYTDLAPKDPEFNLPFQYYFEQAKFALAPTILDRNHPGNHEYVLVYLFNPDSFSNWQDLFIYGKEAKHPWFLPTWTVFGWTWAQGDFNIFTRLSAQVFAEIILITVFGGVFQLLGRIIPAFLAGLWLISIPVLIGHKASIMASFLLSYLLVFLFFVLARNYLVEFMSGSGYRFIYQLLPLAIILLFYSLFKTHPKHD